MARVLGLDLGSYSVKGLLLETGARAGPQVAAFAEVRRAPEGEPSETLKAALKELLANRELHSENVVVSLPGPSLATHQITLPFTDAKRIEATIGFEVESQLPFDLSEAAFDYQVGSQHDKSTELLVGVAHKAELRALVAALQEAGVDPRVITHPALVYLGVMGRPGLEAVPDNEAVAILDLGHERTSLAIGRPGASPTVEFARTFPGGGRDLTRALAAEFGSAPLEAEAWKEAHGAVGPAIAGPEGERASGAFVRGLQPTLREIRSTFKAYSVKSRRRVSRAYLCGGASRLAGLDVQLSHDLAIPCAALPMPQGQGPAAAQAYALGLRGAATGARAPRFNLRRGDLSFKGDFDYLKDRLGLIASYAATVLVLLIASMVVRSSMLARREQAVDASLCDITQRVLGKCETDYSRALAMLRGKESPAAVVPKLSAVSILGELTERVPADVSVTFDQINIDLERVTLRGETDTSHHVDQITQALKAYRCFREVKQGKLEKSKDGQKVSFRLDIQVECPEEAAAPQG